MEFEEYRTCLKKKYIKINCPDNPINRPKQVVPVVVGDLSDYDSEEEEDFQLKVMVIQEVLKKRTLTISSGSRHSPDVKRNRGTVRQSRRAI